MNWLKLSKWDGRAVLIGLSLLVAGCYPASQTPTSPGETVPPESAAAATQTAQPGSATFAPTYATPTIQPSTAGATAEARPPTVPAATSGGAALAPGAGLVRRLTNSCDLIDSHDLATLMTTAEIVRGPHTVGQVDRLTFGGSGVSATESSCIFFAYHKPGSNTGEMLQVQYWVDMPDQMTPEAWSEVWATARAAAQLVTDIGDDAFYDHGRLTFKKGSLYITLQALDSRQDAGSSADENRLMQIEEQLARDMLSRLG